MQALDVVLRAGGAVLLLGLAALLLRDGRRQAAAWLFLPFALGLCGFLARNTPVEALQLSGGPAVAATLLSGNAAIFLWWFALAIFDDEFRLDGWKLAVGAAWLLLSSLDRGFLGERFAGVGFGWATVGLGLGIVGHLAYRLLRDLEGDLVERRRRARVAMAAGLTLMLLTDLGIDLAFGFGWRPHAFTLAQNGAILVLTLGLGAWLLKADVDALAFRSARAAGAPAGPRPLVAAPETNPLLGRLAHLMEVERVYRDPDLTVSRFAALMGAPEPEVRRLVNQQLGHRHFRSFLNAWRVADVRASLADPARAGEKLVGIAMDAGFASLASFNRAFKALEGRAPSEHREAVQRGEIGF